MIKLLCKMVGVDLSSTCEPLIFLIRVVYRLYMYVYISKK